MDNVKFNELLKNFKKNKIFCNNNIKDFEKQKDISVEIKILFSIENNLIDYISKISNEDFNKAVSILYNLDLDEYSSYLSAYNNFVDSNTFSKEQWELLLKDKEILPEEKMYLLKRSHTLESSGKDLLLFTSTIDPNIIQENLPENLNGNSLYKTNVFEKLLKNKLWESLLKSAIIRNDKENILKIIEKTDYRHYSFSLISFKEFMFCAYYFINNSTNEDKKNYIRFFLIDQIQNNISEFKSILNSNQNIKKQFWIDFEKSNSYLNFFISNKELMDYLYNMPEFFETLKNSVGIFEHLSSDLNFFYHLSENNKHKIAYITSQYGLFEIEKIKQVYAYHYANVLSDDEQYELIKYGTSLNKGDSKRYVTNNEIKISKIENVEYILKKLKTNPNYYKEIQLIRDSILNGDLEKSISFSKKYNETALYHEILDMIKKNSSISEELKEKILFLAKKNKLIRIDTLEKLEKTSIQNLEQEQVILEPISELMKQNIKGSGDAKKDTTIFHCNREVIIIKNNDIPSFLPVEYEHLRTLYYIYGDKINLKPEKFNIYNLSCEACRQFGDIILIMEGETLLMFMPKTICANQMYDFKEILQEAKNKDDILIALTIIDKENEVSIEGEEYGIDFFLSNSFLGKYIHIEKSHFQNSNIQTVNPQSSIEQAIDKDESEEAR